MKIINFNTKWIDRTDIIKELKDGIPSDLQFFLDLKAHPEYAILYLNHKIPHVELIAKFMTSKDKADQALAIDLIDLIVSWLEYDKSKP